MRAAQLLAPLRLEVRDAPEPLADALAPSEVLLRVLVAGICGSDLPFFRTGLGPDGAAPEPGFPSHEVVGEVLASRDGRVDVASRVVGWAGDYGGLAELAIARGDELVEYAPSLRPQEAILLQPLACVLYAVEQLERAGPLDGLPVTVLGQGTIGALFSHVLSHRAARVTGVDRVDRHDVAGLLGVTHTVTAEVDDAGLPASLAAAGADEPPAIVVEAIGHQPGTLARAIELLRPEGQLYFFGVPAHRDHPLPLDRMLMNNLTLRSGLTLDRARMLAEADTYVDAHPELLALVSEVRPLADAETAYARAIEPRAGQFKIALTVGDE